MALYGIQLITIIFLRIYLVWQNKKKRDVLKLAHPGGQSADPDPSHRHAFDDLTDNENPDFCYVY